ncbi:flagellar MS-ring protein [Gracilibacillus halophilus YIM-C55.5]|uniref:Flagellar M-ring protein n=1 Tax=Gracilibacillus halophilus YIM-C55.5 TaxID=1308866 RepID=N4WQ30_9BACI|nr:flagellar basal-body MS-ring/collar protein FliF [Gracilibacillus halophilus]ENH98242.1 flagellar MS-ring protein [Gracilibacillus halophilus YIM-C55.5]
MKEKLKIYKDKITEYYKSMGKGKKIGLFGGIGFIIALMIVIGVMANSSNMVPLYSDLSVQEIGQVKEELDARGVPYEIGSAGTSIQVPDESADQLLVDLAAQGIPDSGNIDYSFFAENSSWGTTDNEFDVMKLDAMQTELSNLIASIDGIESAEVMINQPEDPVFVSDQEQPSSASVVLQTQPGYQFQPNQISSLYNLVAKSVPNLSTDNIAIMNQNFEYFDQNNQNNMANSNGNTYNEHQQIKDEIEQDVEQRIQRMLGMMIGRNKVAVSATADVDFTQETRVENRVEPVNEENDTLPVSVETITESYTGNPPIEGEAGTGEGEVPNYPAGEENQNGDYEMVKESVNNEFDRIKREIVESPYKVRDLGIQVAVDNTREAEDGTVEELTQQEQQNVEDSIASILDSVISTSIDGSYGEVNPADKTSIVFQPFNGNEMPTNTGVTPVIPMWAYIVGGSLLVIIIALLFMLRRRRKDDTVEEVQTTAVRTEEEEEVPPITQNDTSDEAMRRKQLEQYAQDKPEEFAKLLRSWLAED